MLDTQICFCRLILVGRNSVLGVFVLTLLVCASATADAQLNPRFKFVHSDANVQFSASSLSQVERQFLSDHPEIRVAVQRASVPPYQSVTGTGEIVGHSVDVLLAIAGAFGLRVTPVVFDSWPEVLAALRDRRVDMTAEISYTSERDLYLDYTVGIAPYPAALIGKVDDVRYRTNQNLQGLRVAVGDGFVAQRYLQLFYPEAIAVPTRDLQAAIEAVQQDKADLYFGATLAGLALASSGKLTGLEVKQQLYFGSGWSHMAVRSDWSVLTRMFSRAISGKRDAIFRGFSETPGSYSEAAAPPLPLSDEEAEVLRRYGVLRIGALKNLPLLNEFVDTDLHSGIASEYTSYLAHRLGVAVELVPFESTRTMLDGLRSNEIDLIPFLSTTPQRRAEFVFSTPYVRIPYVLLGRSAGPRYWGLASVADKTVAMRREHPLLPWLQANYPKMRLLEVETTQQAVEKLADGEADAVVEIKLYANSLINDEYAGLIEIFAEVDQLPGDFSFVAATSSADLIPLIDRSLRGIGQAESNRILARWVAVDLAPRQQLRTIIRFAMPLALIVLTTGLVILVWNRRLAAENKRRVQAEKLVVQMTDGLPTGVFQFKQLSDGRQIRLFVNAASRHLGRMTGEEPVEAPLRFFDYVHEDERDKVFTSLARSFATGEAFHESYRFLFPDGHWGWIISEATAHIDEDDGCYVWSGYLFDLSEERSLNEKLNSLLVEKDEFIAVAGHELRTPIQSVLLGIDSLSSDDLSPTQYRTVLSGTQHAARALSELANDLLDLTRINAHELTLVERVVALRDLVESTCGSMEISARNKNLDFRCDIEADVPDKIRCDPVRVKQILFNLISNAIKYTESGFVRLNVYRVAPGDGASDQALLGFSVSDSGVGIAKDQQDRIFEPFATVGGPAVQQVGLGLAISSRLIQLMGGRISLESQVLNGSTFIVELPLLANLDVNMPAPRDTGIPNLAEGGFRALLVDDNHHARTLVATLLEHAGLSVDQAVDGIDALQQLANNAYAVVLTDNKMPNMNGIELARRIAAQESAGSPVLILLTGAVDISEAQDVRANFDAVLTKPVGTVQIINTLQDLIRARQQGES